MSQEERAELERIACARTSAQQRARILVRAAEGAENQGIAAELGLARHTVAQWRRRFAEARLPGLRDRAHRSPPRGSVRFQTAQGRQAALGWGRAVARVVRQPAAARTPQPSGPGRGGRPSS